MLYTALWLYNKLSECWSVAQRQRKCNQSFPNMHTKDIQYLNSVNDALQYAVKRCEEADNISCFTTPHCKDLR